jgi:hypothetical protein
MPISKNKIREKFKVEEKNQLWNWLPTNFRDRKGKMLVDRIQGRKGIKRCGEKE